MHELSIAESLLELVKQNAPSDADGEIVSVRVRLGPVQAVEPEALAMAWAIAVRDSICTNAALEIEAIPWRIHCPECGRDWDSHDPFDVCACGCVRCHTSGSRDLTLVALEVREPAISKES